MKRTLLLLAGLAASAGCTGTGGSTPMGNFTATDEKKGGPVVVHIGDATITADEITARLNEKSPFERQRFKDPATKKEFVENMARVELLALEAARRGLDKDPDVVRAAQQVMVRKLVSQEIDDNPAKKAMPDEELKAYYDAHHDDFVKPEMVRVFDIFLAANGTGGADGRMAEAQAILADLQARARDTSAFAQVAQMKSDDQATKAVGGDVHFASADQLTQRYGPEVAQAAFALGKPGDLSSVVQTPKGLYVLKMAQRTPAVNQTFEQVKPQLTSRLWYEKRSKLYDAFIEDLKKKQSYSVDEAALAKVEVQPLAPPNKPPSALPPPGSLTPPALAPPNSPAPRSPPPAPTVTQVPGHPPFLHMPPPGPPPAAPAKR